MEEMLPEFEDERRIDWSSILAPLKKKWGNLVHFQISRNGFKLDIERFANRGITWKELVLLLFSGPILFRLIYHYALILIAHKTKNLPRRKDGKSTRLSLSI